MSNDVKKYANFEIMSSITISMNRLQGYIRLFRLERAISATFGVLLTGAIVQNFDIHLVNIYACISVFFSALANFTLNDIHDVRSDEVNNRKDRPLAVGLITSETAFVLAIAFIAISIGSAFLLPRVPRTLIHIGLPVSLLYNVYLKRFLVFKNLFTGLANTGVIMVGGLLVDNSLEPFAVYLAVLGFLFSYSYEIMLDIGDVAGDRVNGVETIPGRFGTDKAAFISVVLGAATIIISPLPFFINYDPRLFHDSIFLVVVFISMTHRARVLMRLRADQSPENITKLKRQMFRNLQISGLGYLMGLLV